MRAPSPVRIQPLEVSGPLVVRRPHRSKRLRIGLHPAMPAAPMRQTFAIQHGAHGAGGWNHQLRMLPLEHHLQFARAPQRMLAAQTQDQGFDGRRGLVGVTQGRPTAFGKCRLPAFTPVPQHFMARHTRDSVHPAQLAHRPISRLVVSYKVLPLVHHSLTFQGMQNFYIPPNADHM
jgi:hypothetical protein